MTAFTLTIRPPANAPTREDYTPVSFQIDGPWVVIEQGPEQISFPLKDAGWLTTFIDKARAQQEAER